MLKRFLSTTLRPRALQADPLPTNPILPSQANKNGTALVK